MAKGGLELREQPLEIAAGEDREARLIFGREQRQRLPHRRRRARLRRRSGNRKRWRRPRRPHRVDTTANAARRGRAKLAASVVLPQPGGPVTQAAARCASSNANRRLRGSTADTFGLGDLAERKPPSLRHNATPRCQSPFTAPSRRGSAPPRQPPRDALDAVQSAGEHDCFPLGGPGDSKRYRRQRLVPAALLEQRSGHCASRSSAARSPACMSSRQSSVPTSALAT